MVNKRGIILLFLSTYNIGAKSFTYSDESGNEYDGMQTYEAPLKSLIDSAINDDCKVEKIMCLITKEVYDKKIDETEATAYTWFCSVVADIFSKNGLEYTDDIICPIYYDFTITDGCMKVIEDSRLKSGKVYEQIVSNIQNIKSNETNDDNKLQVYVDYTGGFRDISFLMTAIIRYLQFEDIECCKIVYSNHSDKKIFEINYIYNMFQLINGVNEFIRTGNGQQLWELYSQNNIEVPLLKSIVDFSNSMSICNLAGIDKSIIELQDNAKIIEKNNKNTEDNIYIDMLNSLIPTIRRKMYLDCILVEDGKQGSTLNYPVLIKWCVENHLIQQAITIYIEKMPVYYYKLGYLDNYVSIEDANTSFGSSCEVALFYTNLYTHFIADNVDSPRAARQLVAQYIADYWDKDWLYVHKRMPKGFYANVYQKKLGEFVKTVDGMSNDSILKPYLSRLKEIMVRYYSSSGDKCNKQSAKDKDVYFSNNPKRVIDMLIGCIDGSYFGMEYIVSGEIKKNKCDTEDVETYKKEPRTIESKVISLKAIENDDDKADIYRKMKYYLAIKLLRNRMNHASSNEFSDDDKCGIEYLEGQGISFCESGGISLDRIVNIIMDGIDDELQ